MSRSKAKPVKRPLCPVKNSAQSDQSLGCAVLWVAKDPNFIQADSQVSDQTGRVPRLI